MPVQGGPAPTQEVQPINSGSNPYRTIRNWGMLPAVGPRGAANGIAIHGDSKSVWVADRCGTGEGWVDSKVDSIQKFDESGQLLIVARQSGGLDY
jgi:hypothetical protein